MITIIIILLFFIILKKIQCFYPFI